MSIYGLLAPRGPSGFGYGSTAAEVTEALSLAGQTLLVTGCNSGIGAETMRVFALRGARVVGTARTGQSKFANLLFAKELARRLAGSERTANAVHPGVIRTNLQRHMHPLASLAFGVFGPLALKNVAEGAATGVYVAARPELAGISGRYVADCNLAEPRSDAEDPALAGRLWAVSEQIVEKLRRG